MARPLKSGQPVQFDLSGLISRLAVYPKTLLHVEPAVYVYFVLHASLPVFS